MTIQLATAPALGLEIVRQTLPLPNLQLVGLGAEGAPAANLQPRHEVKAPYPIYTATIDGLYAGGGLSSAELTAWQYVIESGGVAESTAEVAVADFNADPEVALDYASEQPASYTQALLAAVDDANARPESTAASNFELRILRVPGMNILAIWLQRAGEDVLRLVRGSRAGLVAGRWVTETEFLEAIRPLAEVRRNASDR
jgi:hypothetical protein